MVNNKNKIFAATALATLLSACGTEDVVPNLSPTATPGSTQTVNETTTVNLNGYGTDLDGTITAHNWKQLSGPTVTLINPDTSATSFVAPDVSSETNLVFSLTVTDNDGASHSANVTIIVNDSTTPPTNQKPVVNAGADQSRESLTTVSLSGDASDNDGSITSYNWTQTAGPTVSLINSDKADASFIAPDVTTNTTLSFLLTVTDDDNENNTDTVDILITPKSTQGGSGTVTITWDIPTLRADGVALASSEINGYEITYQLESSTGAATKMTINDASSTQYTTPALSPGKYIFTIRSFDSANAFSASTPPIYATVN